MVTKGGGPQTVRHPGAAGSSLTSTFNASERARTKDGLTLNADGTFWYAFDADRFAYGQAIKDGRGKVGVSMVAIATTTGRAINSHDLRALRVSDLLVLLSQRAAEIDAPIRRAREAATGTPHPDETPTPPAKGRRVRSPQRERELRDLARFVIREQREPGVRQRAADKFGRTLGQIRDDMRAAQEAGWLAPGSRGSRERAKGPRLIEWESRNTRRRGKE